MPNRLAKETSPYLQQHAANPVDWYPWGPEALERARAEDKSILLSIGYSACHWCHVMAHESFEDAGVAEVMNRDYVNVKVDREERPDIDQIYQTAHQMFARGAGGWPLTMFLSPDGTPFFGGTYFPKTSRYGLPGFVELLEARGGDLARQARRDRRAERAGPLGVRAHAAWRRRAPLRIRRRAAARHARRPAREFRRPLRRLRRRAQVSPPHRSRVLPAGRRDRHRAHLEAGIDPTVIALWLGHEHVDTTAIYLHAHLGIKEKALARAQMPNAKPGRYRPSDTLLSFLESL